MSEASGRRLFYWLFCILAGAKLILVADLEVFGQPFDELGYARSIIEHYYNCHPDANWLFIRPLGFPLFGALCMETGIPYRVCIELFFLICTGFFCLSLLPLLRSPWIPLVCALALMVHPWVLTGFNQLLTEPFYLCLILLLLGLAIRLTVQDRWRFNSPALWSFGCLMALMMLTRRESPWVFGILAVVLALRFYRNWRVEGLGFWRASLPLLWVLIPIGTYQGTLAVVSAINYQKWGIFATNEQEALGFSKLLDVLYRIEAPDPSIWAPVTRQTLEMAMQASPMMASLREGLENPHTSNMAFGEQSTGRKGELGAWMWWQLYSSVSVAGHYGSPLEANEWMLQAAAELETALEEGRLPERSFATPFPVDPNISIWLPHLPRLFWDTLKRLHNTGNTFVFREKEAQISAIERPYFDRAANRRISHIADESVDVRGLAFAETGQLDFISIEDAEGVTVAATAPDGEVNWKRSDIRAMTGKDEIFDTAFSVSFIPRTQGPFQLVLWKEGQRLLTYPLRMRTFPHRVKTPRQGNRPASDLTLMSFQQPVGVFHQTEVGLRGWGYCGKGALTHLLAVGPGGNTLERVDLKLKRKDVWNIYEAAMGTEPDGPLGFEMDATFSEAIPVRIQFWRDDLLVHELPMEELVRGYWKVHEQTLSGIPLSLGIGYQMLPVAAPEATFREEIRAFLLDWYLLILLFTVCLPALWVALRYFVGDVPPPFSSIDLNLAILLLCLALLGRALFYGLVEAAVVPGVSRYMDCVSPLAAVFLALLVFLGIVRFAGLSRRVIDEQPKNT
jgi:hypothetical protein